MRFLLFFGLALFSYSCSAQLGSDHAQQHQLHRELDEIRTELADVKHMLKTSQVQVRLVEEKVTGQDAKNTATKGGKLEQISQQLSSLERKLAQLEKLQESTSSDLRTLNQHANQTNSALNQYKDKIYEFEKAIASHERRLDDVAKLKSTLATVSKAIGQKSQDDSALRSYKIQPGDSLEKIARKNHTTIDVLKRVNRLQNDRIIVGQEIKIPYDE